MDSLLSYGDFIILHTRHSNWQSSLLPRIIRKFGYAQECKDIAGKIVRERHGQFDSCLLLPNSGYLIFNFQTHPLWKVKTEKTLNLVLDMSSSELFYLVPSNRLHRKKREVQTVKRAETGEKEALQKIFAHSKSLRKAKFLIEVLFSNTTNIEMQKDFQISLPSRKEFNAIELINGLVSPLPLSEEIKQFLRQCKTEANLPQVI